jgi:hypothetical protein
MNEGVLEVASRAIITFKRSGSTGPMSLPAFGIECGLEYYIAAYIIWPYQFTF